MKKALFSIALVMCVLSLFGQTDLPTYGYNYQAIIRNANGNIVANEAVQLQFQILNTADQVQYKETQATSTDQFGKVVAVVGSGTATLGLFDTLDWAARKHYLGVAVKIGGAGDWVPLGKGEVVHQLLARYARSRGDRFVGSYPLQGDGDGGISIRKGYWQQVTKTTYDGMESYFSNIPIPSGMTREFYLHIQSGDNIDDCSTGSEWRFYFSWANKPGHLFVCPHIWGDPGAQKTQVLQIPSVEKQGQASNITNFYYRLEARMPDACDWDGFEMRVFSVYLFAIDKPNGIEPPINLSGGLAGGNQADAFIGPEKEILFPAAGGIKVRGTTETDILVILGNDRAERFLTTTGEALPAGTVAVFDDTQPGKIRASTTAYDRKRTGIVSDLSETGKYRPGIIHEQENTRNGSPVALDGTVEVLAIGPIAVGDYLTTSKVPGHAMQAKSRRKSYGAVLGQAITPLEKGERGKVEMMVERR